MGSFCSLLSVCALPAFSFCGRGRRERRQQRDEADRYGVTGCLAGTRGGLAQKSDTGGSPMRFVMAEHYFFSMTSVHTACAAARARRRNGDDDSRA